MVVDQMNCYIVYICGVCEKEFKYNGIDFMFDTLINAVPDGWILKRSGESFNLYCDKCL